MHVHQLGHASTRAARGRLAASSVGLVIGVAGIVAGSALLAASYKPPRDPWSWASERLQRRHERLGAP